jgi:hypothetical protein
MRKGSLGYIPGWEVARKFQTGKKVIDWIDV